jgi:hypothetical protein
VNGPRPGLCVGYPVGELSYWRSDHLSCGQFTPPFHVCSVVEITSHSHVLSRLDNVITIAIDAADTLYRASADGTIVTRSAGIRSLADPAAVLYVVDAAGTVWTVPTLARRRRRSDDGRHAPRRSPPGGLLGL